VTAPGRSTARIARTAAEDYAQAVAPVLARSVEWLLRTGQPDGAIISHHGLLFGPADDRIFLCSPRSALDLPVITVEVEPGKRRYRDRGAYRELANPLRPGELEVLAGLLDALGAPVSGTWNGHPTESGSLGLAFPAHPGLLAAERRYRAGCPEHPDKSVFCDCGWYQTGRDLIATPPAAV
jgi:hypothetical protein